MVLGNAYIYNPHFHSANEYLGALTSPPDKGKLSPLCPVATSHTLTRLI